MRIVGGLFELAGGSRRDPDEAVVKAPASEGDLDKRHEACAAPTALAMFWGLIHIAYALG